MRKRNKIYGNLSELEQKFVKLYSMEELKILKNKTPEELEKVVTETSANVMRAKKELEANPEFQRAQEILKPLREAFGDAVKWQETKKRVALSILHKHGRVDIGEDVEGGDE